ncbi:unnamed protein product [Cuscuta epithymum]|uniref:Uncharacterized protein n=1 Tax=Cuscuta epithymum TaxID=186058 RepID=A0AAV0EQS0_9ASTE|nr:unnamed protein product [Cuscuta epithymum]
MTASGGLAKSTGRGELCGFQAGQMIDNGGSIIMVPRIRTPPEPPSWVVRGDRIRESFPISYYVFVNWILVIVYVVRFVSLFGISALFMSLMSMFRSMRIGMAVSRPLHGQRFALLFQG